MDKFIKIAIKVVMLCILFLVTMSIYLTYRDTETSDFIIDNSNTRITDSTIRVNPVNELSLREMMLFKTQDSLIKELIRLTKSYEKELKKRGSVTKIVTNTVFRDSVVTKYNIDTVLLDNNSFIYPEYNATLNNEWYRIKLRMNREMSYIDSLLIFNNYDVIQGTEKYGFLKLKKRDFVEVVNYNPYTTFTDVKTYITPDKKKNFVLGVGIFGGVTPKGIDYGIGINLSYKLIEF